MKRTKSKMDATGRLRGAPTGESAHRRQPLLFHEMAERDSSALLVPWLLYQFQGVKSSQQLFGDEQVPIIHSSREFDSFRIDQPLK